MPTATNTNQATLHDVALVGAGPIGLELAAALKRAAVEAVHFEAGQIGRTIARWPPNTHFFSSPERIAIAGVPIPNVDQTKITGEAYLAYLRSVVEQFDLRIRTYERVLNVSPEKGEFIIQTENRAGRQVYRARRVVLATGGLARARRLDIPGEDLPHVSHYPADPHKYFRTRVLVVGGRNSALETALRCFRAGARVTISYRRDALDPEIPKPHLVAEITMWMEEGKIDFLPATVPVEITPRHVALAPTRHGQATAGPRTCLPADFVLLCTGFEADMSLCQAAGVELQGDRRVPVLDPRTLQTNVPGLYVAGTATAGTQERFRAFIETCHVDVEKIVAALTGGKAP